MRRAIPHPQQTSLHQISRSFRSAMRNKSGTQTPANASEGPAILQPTQHSCTGLDREGLTPSAWRAISNSPSQRRSGSQAHGVHTQPTGQPRSAGNQSCTPHAVRARTAPRVLRPEAPGGSPRQWSFSSPGAHDGHPRRGPRTQGYHVQTKCPCTGLASSGLPAKLAPPPASADDGAAKAGPQAPGPGDVLPFKRPGHLPVDSGSPPCTGEGMI